jgi:hypothetical protein
MMQPVILTTHEVAGPTYDDSVYPYQSGDDEDNASLSAYGPQLWDGLINDNDQIFLTLNGHYWPPGRTALTNAAGNDVHVHITNYQNRYFGGAAMIRLYHFDLELNTIEVETIAPYFLEQPAGERNLLAAQLAELTATVDRFSVPIDFTQRFSGFDPIPVRPARPAREMLDLTTAAGAPLNTETFAGGYTFEVFVQVPTDWNSNSWMAALSRWGESGQAGKSAGNTDPNEPIATFSLSDGREPQWCVYPLNLDDESTNWGQGLPEATWWHPPAERR